MSSTIAILSSVALDAVQLTDFVLALDGFAVSSPEFRGRLSDGNRHIWIYLSPEELPHHLEDEDEKAEIVSKLGGLPQTNIPIEISSTAGSKQIALNFALAFGKKWPVVVSNLYDKIFSLDELKAMQNSDDISFR